MLQLYSLPMLPASTVLISTVPRGLHCLICLLPASSTLQEALSARLGQVAEFTQQSDALKAAAAGLEARIAQDEEQVRAAVCAPPFAAASWQHQYLLRVVAAVKGLVGR